MRTYYIFNVNKYFCFMYKNKPLKLYKLFEEIYYSKNFKNINIYNDFKIMANLYNTKILNEYIYYEFKQKYGYSNSDNVHYLSNKEKTTLSINNYIIKITTENNYSLFFRFLNNYNNNLFVCDFDNMDYFWLSKLYSDSQNLSKETIC